MTDAWEIARLSAVDLTRRYAAGELSPVEALEAILTVVADAEPDLNALAVFTDDAARAAAEDSATRWRAGTPRGPLDGVPATVKENLARAGIPLTYGCAGVDPVTPRRDAPVVERLTEAGALIVGSTVMPDWGMLSSGVSSLHGITRSPWNPAWTTGGSSSGAGAAAAAGYGPLHVGTDIGGSIRLPGTWLGLATLKPSAGRVPLDAPYLGRVAGPMTRSVTDAAALMAVLSRPDARDWTALPPADLPWTTVAEGGTDGGSDRPREPVSGLRVGLQLDAGCGMPVDPAVADAATAVAQAFAAAGAVVEPLSTWLDDDLLGDLDTFWRVRSWNDARALSSEGRQRVLPFVRRWVAPAAAVDGSRLMACYASILEIQRRTVAATDGLDLVISPVAPVLAFPAEWPMPFGDVDAPDLGMAHIGFTAPWNLSGQPAATVNAGFAADGRPIGVQLGGPRFDDVGVLRAAAWWERNRPPSAVPDWPIRRRSAGRATPASNPTSDQLPTHVATRIATQTETQTETQADLQTTTRIDRNTDQRASSHAGSPDAGRIGLPPQAPV